MPAGDVRYRDMKKQIIVMLSCVGLLSGCGTVAVRRLDRDMQGEWQLIRWSYRDMVPGHGELVCCEPCQPLLLIIRNGYVVSVQDTNVVSSTPYHITTSEDGVGGGSRQILHSHPGRDCLAWASSHDSIYLQDGTLHRVAWDVEWGIGWQNANVYEYRRAVGHEMTYSSREQPVGGAGKPAQQR